MCVENSSKRVTCLACKSSLGEFRPHQHFQPLINRQKLSNLQNFRMIIPNLLYVIGLPKKFGSQALLSSKAFFG